MWSGRLLVATPLLGDPNFERTVVLVLEHGEDGTLGVVLNRPSGLGLAEPLPEWASLACEPPVVFVGGPVGQGTIIGLVRRTGDLPEGRWAPVTGDTGVVDLGLDPADTYGSVDALRVFTGYAGWGPAQLDDEIRQGSWFVVDPDPSDTTTAEPGRLWQAVLGRQPPPLRRYALFPPDPSVN